MRTLIMRTEFNWVRNKIIIYKYAFQENLLMRKYTIVPVLFPTYTLKGAYFCKRSYLDYLICINCTNSVLIRENTFH